MRPGRWAAGEQMMWETKDRVSKARLAKVAKTLPRTSWVCPPGGVRLPPKTLRLTTKGRTACSAGQFVLQSFSFLFFVRDFHAAIFVSPLMSTAEAVSNAVANFRPLAVSV